MAVISFVEVGGIIPLSRVSLTLTTSSWTRLGWQLTGRRQSAAYASAGSNPNEFEQSNSTHFHKNHPRVVCFCGSVGVGHRIGLSTQPSVATSSLCLDPVDVDKHSAIASSCVRRLSSNPYTLPTKTNKKDPTGQFLCLGGSVGIWTPVHIQLSSHVYGCYFVFTKPKSGIRHACLKTNKTHASLVSLNFAPPSKHEGR